MLAQVIPRLLKLDYDVTVLDLMIYGEDVLDEHPKLKKLKVILEINHY